MLVFALDLEDVEEVCGRGADGNKVFVGFWGGEGKGGDLELVERLWGAVILTIARC